jgi:hypothetical protein
MSGLVMLVAKISVPHALSKFRAAPHPETPSRPNDNAMVPHPAVRVTEVEKFYLSWGHHHCSSMSRYVMPVMVPSAKRNLTVYTW